MSKITTTTWPLEQHTKAKHIILRKYLDAWIPILGFGNGRVVYIDGFAGPGKYNGGEDGSPVIAINAIIGHKMFQQMNTEFKLLFIEENKNRYDHLVNVLSTIDKKDNERTAMLAARNQPSFKEKHLLQIIFGIIIMVGVAVVFLLWKIVWPRLSLKK